MSSIFYLPPPGAVRLPRELRRAVLAAAGDDPRRHDVLTRQAVRLLVEFGQAAALARLQGRP